MWTKLFDQFAHTTARLSGKPLAFGLACLLVLGRIGDGDARLRTTAEPAFTKA